MDDQEFDARERLLLDGRKPEWIERWREPGGAITITRFDARVSLTIFAGAVSDPGGDWIAPLLERAVAGHQQLHFMDQGLLLTPNSKVRNVYVDTLRRRRPDLDVGHLYIPSSSVILRVIASAANVLLTGLGQFHQDCTSFDRALDRALTGD